LDEEFDAESADLDEDDFDEDDLDEDDLDEDDLDEDDLDEDDLDEDDPEEDELDEDDPDEDENSEFDDTVAAMTQYAVSVPASLKLLHVAFGLTIGSVDEKSRRARYVEDDGTGHRVRATLEVLAGLERLLPQLVRVWSGDGARRRNTHHWPEE
jgi:hypothetical protein